MLVALYIDILAAYRIRCTLCTQHEHSCLLACVNVMWIHAQTHIQSRTHNTARGSSCGGITQFYHCRIGNWLLKPLKEEEKEEDLITSGCNRSSISRCSFLVLRRMFIFGVTCAIEAKLCGDRVAVRRQGVGLELSLGIAGSRPPFRVNTSTVRKDLLIFRI